MAVYFSISYPRLYPHRHEPVATSIPAGVFCLTGMPTGVFSRTGGHQLVRRGVQPYQHARWRPSTTPVAAYSLNSMSAAFQSHHYAHLEELRSLSKNFTFGWYTVIED